jgi:hypothetical protein
MLRARTAAALGRPWLLLPLVGLLGGTTIRALAPEPEMASPWRDRDIRIDGADDEWVDLTSPVSKQRFTVGFVNDGDSLYFCLVTRDRVTRTQILRQGLIVWLDPVDGKKKTFGIHFPLGFGANVQGRPRGQVPDAAGGQTASNRERPPDDVSLGAQDAVEILGPGRRDVRRLPFSEAGGIEVRVGIHDVLLTYEMKVPFLRTDIGPYGVRAEPGSVVRAELQTAEWRGPAPITQAPGGIGVGVGVGGGPGGGIIYPPVDAALLRPMDVATRVRLASGPGRRQ